MPHHHEQVIRRSGRKSSRSSLYIRAAHLPLWQLDFPQSHTTVTPLADENRSTARAGCHVLGRSNAVQFNLFSLEFIKWKSILEDTQSRGVCAEWWCGTCHRSRSTLPILLAPPISGSPPRIPLLEMDRNTQSTTHQGAVHKICHKGREGVWESVTVCDRGRGGKDHVTSHFFYFIFYHAYNTNLSCNYHLRSCKKLNL